MCVWLKLNYHCTWKKKNAIGEVFFVSRHEKTKIWHISKENVSHEFDMDSDIFGGSPTSVWMMSKRNRIHLWWLPNWLIEVISIDSRDSSPSWRKNLKIFNKIHSCGKIMLARYLTQCASLWIIWRLSWMRPPHEIWLASLPSRVLRVITFSKRRRCILLNPDLFIEKLL